MIAYNKNMSASEEDIANLNNLVNSINEHLGTEAFELNSNEECWTECVDIFEEGEVNSTYMSFEDAILYLQGVKTGVLIKEKCAV